MESVSVNRDEFESKCKEAFEKTGSNRCMWTRSQLEKVKSILIDAKNGLQKESAHYHYLRKYEILQIGSESHVIVKQKSDPNNLVYMVPMEEFYPKLLEAHNNTGHGGRDKMIYYIKKKWCISRMAIEIFRDCCHTCTRKKTTIRKGVVIKPIVTHGFNSRGQVDLIDFQSCPDGEFNWIMNYQDHATKFLHLRPLKSKHAVNVAEELSKIFFTFGAPSILQSDNGREFVAAVINELVIIWPHCKILHGRPRHPQSQGSVERANADVENMLRAWMVEKNSNNWSRGCFEVEIEADEAIPILTSGEEYQLLIKRQTIELEELQHKHRMELENFQKYQLQSLMEQQQLTNASQHQPSSLHFSIQGQTRSSETCENVILGSNLQSPTQENINPLDREDALQLNLQQNSYLSHILPVNMLSLENLQDGSIGKKIDASELGNNVNNTTVSNEVMHRVPNESNVNSIYCIQSFEDTSISNYHAHTADERISQTEDSKSSSASLQSSQIRPTTILTTDVGNTCNATTREEIPQTGFEDIISKFSELEQ